MEATDRVLAVVLTAATPVVELRGAIPLALALGLPPWQAWVWSVLGNLLPVPLLLWGTEAARRWLESQPRLQRYVRRWGERSSSRLAGHVRRWGWLGLAAFVAVPLPGTGAWTGAVGAALLGMRPWPALAAIALGVSAAGLAVATAGAAAVTIGR